MWYWSDAVFGKLVTNSCPFSSPDRSVLAFSLGDTKQVVLCSVEKAEILHVFHTQKPVSCMHWMEVTEECR